MSDAAELLVLALGRSLAPSSRVLLVGDDFDALQLIAQAPVQELVVITALADPNAPAGETPTGAPLRLRLDWKERASSKDVIIDPKGVAHAADVLRILKKKGVYLSPRADGAIADLPYVTPISSGFAAALVAGTPDGLVAMAPVAEDGPTVFAAGKSSPVAMPQIALTVPEALSPSAAVIHDPEIELALQATLEQARLALEAQAESIAVLQLDADRVPELTATVDRLKGTLKTSEAAVAASKPIEAELAKARSALAELEDDYEQVRDELATRRVADHRIDRVKARYERARAELGEEVQRLKTELLDVAESTADYTRLRAERDTARQVAKLLSGALGHAMGALAGWTVAANPPPQLDPAALEPWLALVHERVEGASAEIAARGERITELEHALADRDIGALRTQVDASQRASQQAPTPGPAPIAEAVGPHADELKARIAALEGALEAERALRAAEQAQVLRVEALAGTYATREAQLRTQLSGASRESAKARLAEAKAEETSRRLRAEVELRGSRSDELTRILKTHGQMQILLAQELERVENARDAAEQRRQLADENLRILRLEFERLRGQLA